MDDRESKLLSVREAAEALGVNRQRVQQLIESKRLPAEKVGSYYVIKENDLKLVRNRKPGRPPKQPADTTKQLNEALRQTIDGQATPRKARNADKKNGKK